MSDAWTCAVCDQDVPTSRPLTPRVEITWPYGQRQVAHVGCLNAAIQAARSKLSRARRTGHHAADRPPRPGSAAPT